MYIEQSIAMMSLKSSTIINIQYIHVCEIQNWHFIGQLKNCIIFMVQRSGSQNVTLNLAGWVLGTKTCQFQCITLLYPVWPGSLMLKLYPTSRKDVTSQNISTCAPVFQQCHFVVMRIFSCIPTTALVFKSRRLNIKYTVTSCPSQSGIKFIVYWYMPMGKVYFRCNQFIKRLTK